MNQNKLVRLLITGGAGLLGGRITRRLVEMGHDVHLILRASTDRTRIADLLHKVSIHDGDLSTSGIVSKVLDTIKPELLINSAASGGHSGARDREALFRNNLLSTHRLIESLSNLPGCRLIHIGSSTCYGQHDVALHESLALCPTSAFGAHKAVVSLLLHQATTELDISFIELRPFSIYGYGESSRRLIPKTINAAFCGTPLPLTRPGYMHDFVFVEDVVDACMQAISRTDIKHDVFNVGSGLETTNEEVVALIEQLTGRSITIIENAYPTHRDDKLRWCADTAKAERRLGWKARTTLVEGLQYCIDSYSERVAKCRFRNLA